MLTPNRFGTITEHWNTDLKCRVVTIKTVVRKDFGEGSEGQLLTPTEHIFMACPLDKPKETVV